MSWKYALCMVIIMNSSIIILNKVLSNKLAKKSIGVFYQFLFCALLAVVYFFFLGKAPLNPIIILMGLMGFTASFGVYFQWRALECQAGLSKTALFLPLISMVPIVLAIIFLAEIKLWNFQSTLGIGLCFLAMWLFQSPTKSQDKSKEILNKKWFLFTLGMVTILGTVIFLMKLSSKDIAQEIFLMGWYCGAFLGSIIILKLERQKMIQVFQIPRKIILLIMASSFSMIVNLFALYWTFQLGAPISLATPLHGLGITIIPVFFGWFILKERKELSKKEWMGFLVGIIGAFLILFR